MATPAEHGLKQIVGLLNQQFELGELLHVTLLSAREVMTFASDNWEHLASATDHLIAQERTPDDRRYVVVVRRFDDPDETGPDRRKSIGSLTVYDGHVVSIPASEMRKASLTDATTGGRLSPEPGVLYVDGKTLVPGIDDRDAPTARIIPFDRRRVH